jgi:ribosomal protein S18 acetylase RimI-like enzyme
MDSSPSSPRSAPGAGDGVVELRVKFAVDDVALSRLHRRGFGPDDAASAPGMDRPWAARLERHSLTWVGAFVSGTLVGFVHAVWDGGGHAFLLDTVVDPAHQGRGVGRSLVRPITDEAFAAGCAWVHVDYTQELTGFYQNACGFRPTAAGLRSAATG